MARPGAGMELDKGRIVGRERSSRRVETVNEQLIQAQVCRQGKAVVGRGADRVRVRRLLTFGIHALPVVLDESRGLAQPAVLAQRKHSQAAAAVVRDQNVFTRSVERHVAGTRTARGALVQEAELARFRINGEGAHRTTLFALVVTGFVDGVKESTVRRNSEKRGTRRLPDEP